MHGLGNDYIYIDCTKNNLPTKNLSRLSKILSERHFGIGSDGLIIILSSKIADFKMRIINSDGSEAQMCGNGIRCVGKFVYENKLTSNTNLNIETLSGIKNLKLHLQNGLVDKVTVDMGKPIFEPAKIPVISSQNKIRIDIESQKFSFTCLSMGNPHAITFVDNLNKIDVNKYGKVIENDPHFPQKTNVEFAQIIHRNHIKMKVWERGSEITLACGTGACAVCTAAIINNLSDKNKDIKIELPGGNLNIIWNENIFMTGTATTVFEGKIDEQKFLMEEK